MKKKTKKRKNNLNDIEQAGRIENALDAILDLIEPFCKKYLNEEYWEICHDMAIEIYEMGAPLDKGKPQSWASGIVHATGMVNFLSDPSFPPYMESSQIAEAFGISQSTMQSKSKEIRDALDIVPMDPQWCLESLLADNPLVWMFENMDGLIADIRNAPREVQEMAYREGMIPFIPADYPQQNKEQVKFENNTKIIQFPSGKKKKTESEPVSEQKDNGQNLFDKLKD